MNYTKTIWVNSSFPFINATNLNKIEQALFDLGALVDPAALLTAIKTVDGPGSGLDADLLDGLTSAAFATSAQGAKADSALQDGYTAVANQPNSVELANEGSVVGAFRVKANGAAAAGAAFFSFERNNQIILFGLDQDGKIKIGAGTLGTVSYELLHKGNTKIATGSSSFLGNNSERTIAHGLGSVPSFADVVPIAATNGYLGEYWVRKDATNIYVGNTGSSTVAFSWKAELLS